MVNHVIKLYFWTYHIFLTYLPIGILGGEKEKYPNESILNSVEISFIYHFFQIRYEFMY
jgi:hypothetical protein